MRSLQDWTDAYLPLITDAEASACTDAEIDAFEQKWQVAFREDHKRFLRRFGGWAGRRDQMPKFLNITNSLYDLNSMDYHYEDELNFPDEVHIPSGWLMFGMHDVDNFVAVNQRTGELCTYYGDVLYDFYAESIDKFLVQRLFSYINFYSTRDKNRQLGFYGLRKFTSNDELISFLESNDFDVIQELCDHRQIFAQRGDVYFLSDFGSPRSQPTNPHHYGDFRFATPAKDERVIWSLSKELASVLGVAHRIHS